MRNYNVYLETPRGKDGEGGGETRGVDIRGRERERGGVASRGLEYDEPRSVRSKGASDGLSRVTGEGKYSSAGDPALGNRPAFFVCPKSEGNRVIEELIRTRSAF